MKKQVLTLAFAVFALNCAYGQAATKNTDMDNLYKIAQNNAANPDGAFFLHNKLGYTNIEEKLNNKYLLAKAQPTQNAAAHLADIKSIDNAIKARVARFNLQEEYKKVKPDTQIVKIDYSKVRPHMHKRKILAAVRSEAAAYREVEEKEDTLKRVDANLKTIAAKAIASKSAEYKKAMLSTVENTLNAVNKAEYILALEITKQAVK